MPGRAATGGPRNQRRQHPPGLGETTISLPKAVIHRVARPFLGKPVVSPLCVIFDPRGRSDTSLFVRSAPKATIAYRNATRRFVPKRTFCSQASISVWPYNVAETVGKERVSLLLSGMRGNRAAPYIRILGPRPQSSPVGWFWLLAAADLFGTSLGHSARRALKSLRYFRHR